MLNILATIYPISFGICLLSLILWFFFRNSPGLTRKLSFSFLGSFVIYLVSLAFSPAALAPKLLILFRDLMVLGIVSQFFNAFKHNKILFTGMLAALLIIFQVGYFKMTKGRRIFRMAPLHHHFELKGWPEPKVIVRFWIIAIALALIALSTLKIR